jgi:hypothetical protein
MRGAGRKIYDRLSKLKTTLSHTDALVCFVLPLAVSLVVFVFSRLLAPRINSANAGDYSSLFSTLAQLIVTLLVALAIELRTLRALNARLLITAGTLSYVAVGAAAAVVALNPTLSPCAYGWLFALAMTGGAGALLSVTLTAYRGFVAEVERLREKVTQL